MCLRTTIIYTQVIDCLVMYNIRFITYEFILYFNSEYHCNYSHQFIGHNNFRFITFSDDVRSKVNWCQNPSDE